MSNSSHLTFPEIGGSGADGLFSPNELETIYNTASFHLTHLMSLRKELIEESRNQIQPVFALDFQEIFTYMYPYSSKSMDSVVINYFLENSNAPFVLLSGTSYELKVHLTKIASELNILPRLVKQGEEPDSRTSFQIDKLLNEAHIDRIVALENRLERTPPLSRLVGALAVHTNAVNRLKTLLQSARFITLDEIYPGQEELGIDEKAYEVSKNILGIVRPSLSESNIADSLNISTVIWSRKNLHLSKYKTYLVTHTPTLLRHENWQRSEEAREYGLDPEIFKTPLDAFYSSVIKKHSQDINGQIRFISAAINKCAALQNRVIQMPNFLGGKEKHYSKDFQDIWTRTESSIQSLALEEDLQNFQVFFQDPFTKTVELYLGENSRHNINIMEIYQEGASKENLSELQMFETMEKLRGFIELTMEMAGRTTGFISKEITLPDPGKKDKRFVALNVFSAKEKRETSPITGTKKYSITTSEGKVLISLEKFSSGFYSVYWQTLIPVNEFALQINNVIEKMGQTHRSLKHEITNFHFDREEDFELQGILLKTNKGEHAFSLQFPFKLEHIFSNLEQDEVVLFVRVNTLAGDFYIEVFSPESKRPHIMGFMTHRKLLPEILELFESSSKNFYWPYLLSMQLKNELSDFF